MFVVLYFLMIRPQRKQQQKHQDTLSKLQKGDHVITIGRLHGVVDEINNEDKTVTLDADGIFLVFDLRAIAQVTQKTASTTVATDDTEKSENESTEDSTEKVQEEVNSVSESTEKETSEDTEESK
ncbi:preprotein translocase subunit YajC [Secundilactobacillus malefermentans]|nr:preprotein translocase subunit YajC [Secundilactobacillus malefermentans]